MSADTETIMLSLELVVGLHNEFEAMNQWGHTPHWVSAALAAFADGEPWGGSEKIVKLLAIAFGFKDGPGKEERDKLFQTCRILDDDDFRPGRRLNPIANLVPFEEPEG